jgi:hypothetical protein
MEPAVPEESLGEQERKEIFLALVQAQDSKMSVAASRKEIARRFQLTDRQLRVIEREGLENDWPPL